MFGIDGIKNRVRNVENYVCSSKDETDIKIRTIDRKLNLLMDYLGVEYHSELNINLPSHIVETKNKKGKK